MAVGSANKHRKIQVPLEKENVVVFPIGLLTRVGVKIKKELGPRCLESGTKNLSLYLNVCLGALGGAQDKDIALRAIKNTPDTMNTQYSVMVIYLLSFVSTSLN